MDSLERDRVPSPRPIAAREAPLVDRAGEMDVLKENVYKTVQGEGGLVLIHGEAGIGKTRLIREVSAYAQSRGVRVLQGRCPALFRMDGVPPYIIWKEVIKDYLETCTPEQLQRVVGYYPAEVAKLVPELSQKLKAIPPSFQISSEQEQNRLFEAVYQFISNIARETPLLVVLDDLQWTDPSSLLLLHYLVRGVPRTPLLLLGAYRSTEIDAKHPLTPILAELKRERLPLSVSLKRMSLDETSEMIRQILEQDDVPTEFCRSVFEKTRGNPFFTEEVVESLKEEGIIYREDGRWKFKEVSSIEFPESVRNVVKARISRLDDECQKVLTMASFVGNEFVLEVLQGVVGLEEDRLRRIMDELLKTGLLKHRVAHGQDVCSFADIIVRDVVYEEVGTFERKKLHATVGTAIEKAYAKKSDEHLGELASHFLESGNRDKALDYFLRAGEKAVGVYANKEAISYFKSALKQLEERENTIQERGRVLEKLGDIESLVGEYDECIKSWNDALLLWTPLNEKSKTARLHRKMAGVLWSELDKTDEAKHHQDKALKILEAEPESVELATLYADMCHMLWRMGDLTTARSHGEKALELAKRLNAHEAVASAYIDLGVISGLAGQGWKICGEYCERALKIALDNGCIETALRAYIDLAVNVPAEEHERSLELLKEGHELAKKVGLISNQSWFDDILASTYIGMGEMGKATLLAEESLALDEKSGNAVHLPSSLNVLGTIHQIRGEWDKCEEYFKRSLSLSERSNDVQKILNCYHDLGGLYFEKGDFVKAREFWEKSYEITEKANLKSFKMYAAAQLLWVYVELGEFEKVKGSIDGLYGFKKEAESEHFWLAILDVHNARLFRAERKWEESIAYFERSLQEWELINARKWYIYDFAKLFLCEYARMFMERDEQGDREKARVLLNQAMEIFEKLEAKKDIEATEAKLMRIEGRQVVSEHKPADYVTTGYADLDKLLRGGIPPNYAVALTAPSCDERDLLIESFLETGAKNGEVTFHVTIDPGITKPLVKRFQSNFYLFVCNPQADAIIGDSPNVFKLKGVENLTDIGIALTSAIRNLDPSLRGSRRICVGFVSDVLLQHHTVQTRKWLAGLIPELKSAGFTTLGVMDSRIHPPEELYAIVGLFDGEINIREKETEKGLERYLRIKKMSNQKYLEDELPLKKEQS